MERSSHGCSKVGRLAPFASPPFFPALLPFGRKRKAAEIYILFSVETPFNEVEPNIVPLETNNSGHLLQDYPSEQQNMHLRTAPGSTFPADLAHRAGCGEAAMPLAYPSDTTRT